MRAIKITWGALALLCLAFLTWHTPLRPALTEDEVRAAFSQMSPRDMQRGGDPQAALTFFLTDDGAPFYMVNLTTQRAEARYAEGSPHSARTGEAAARAYAAVVLPNLLRRGSYPVLITRRITTMDNTMGAEAGAFQSAALVRYRSRRDLLHMIADPAFQAGVPHKWASLAENLSAPSAPVLTIGLGLIVPLFLGLIGGLATLLILLRQTRSAGFPTHDKAL